MDNIIFTFFPHHQRRVKTTLFRAILLYISLHNL